MTLETSDAAPITDPPVVHRVEIALSLILRLGVTLSVALIIFGTVMTFLHHPEYMRTALPIKEVTRIAEPFPHTVSQTVEAVRQFRGQGFVILGLLVLLLTPVVSVFVSVIAFALQKDRAFTIIATIVLLILILSLFLGKAEGG